MILVDTGPIVAVINDRDDHHRECTHLLERLPGPLLIPAAVATEVCLLLERRRGTYAELAFLSDVRAGQYTLIESLSADLERITELVEKYDDLPLGTVDASVIALAERLNVTTRGHPRPPRLRHRTSGPRACADPIALTVVSRSVAHLTTPPPETA